MSALELRIKALLAQLAKLSEAPAAKFNKGGKRAPHESKAPAGAKPDWKGEPDPDDSLLVWFLYKLERARSELDKVGLVAQTEIRLQKRLDAKVARSEAGAFGTAMRETADDRDDRIIADYVDLHPMEVSAVESERSSYCSPANVRIVRLKRGCDPTTGRPTKRELEVEEYAVYLSGEGLSIQSVAMRVGRPKSTVQTWLAKDKAKRKAREQAA